MSKRKVFLFPPDYSSLPPFLFLSQFLPFPFSQLLPSVLGICVASPFPTLSVDFTLCVTHTSLSPLPSFPHFRLQGKNCYGVWRRGVRTNSTGFLKCFVHHPQIQNSFSYHFLLHIVLILVITLIKFELTIHQHNIMMPINSKFAVEKESVCSFWSKTMPDI